MQRCLTLIWLFDHQNHWTVCRDWVMNHIVSHWIALHYWITCCDHVCEAYWIGRCYICILKATDFGQYVMYVSVRFGSQCESYESQIKWFLVLFLYNSMYRRSQSVEVNRICIDQIHQTLPQKTNTWQVFLNLKIIIKIINYLHIPSNGTWWRPDGLPNPTWDLGEGCRTQNLLVANVGILPLHHSSQVQVD